MSRLRFNLQFLNFTHTKSYSHTSRLPLITHQKCFTDIDFVDPVWNFEKNSSSVKSVSAPFYVRFCPLLGKFGENLSRLRFMSASYPLFGTICVKCVSAPFQPTIFAFYTPKIIFAPIKTPSNHSPTMFHRHRLCPPCLEL